MTIFLPPLTVGRTAQAGVRFVGDSLHGHRRASAARSSWARQVLNLRPLACEASALPLSYAPGGDRVAPGDILSALAYRPTARTSEPIQKETAARARVAPPSVVRAESSDVRAEVCTCNQRDATPNVRSDAIPANAGTTSRRVGYDRIVELSDLAIASDSKILLVVLDGLGGMADGHNGTELEEADTPNLDRLAAEGATGLLDPVGPGITPGSGPGHLALFGYDPLEHLLGRGALSAAGLGVELHPGDVAARGNLCTLDADGNVVDRRAGRPSDGDAGRVLDLLANGVRVPGAEIVFRHERGHRFLLVLRGDGLDPRVADTDPQHVGVAPLPPRALDPAAARTAELASAVIAQARRVLAAEPAANGILLRGFDSHRELPAFGERTRMRAVAIAVYPMYRGIASLLGFEVLGPPADLGEEVTLLGKHWDEADFFFLHHKDADAAGEDGDRIAKIAAIERLDAVVPDLRALEPDVIAVTGDHATPSQMAAHSWHPVPVLVHGALAGRDGVDRFGERWCREGALGRRPSRELLPILMATAGRLAKYGA